MKTQSSVGGWKPTFGRTDRHSTGTCRDDHLCLETGSQHRSRGESGDGGGAVAVLRQWSRENVRDRMCLATCWGRVKVAWHTGHL